MKITRLRTLAIALLGASALVAIWPAPAQEVLPLDNQHRFPNPNFGNNGNQKLTGDFVHGQADVETGKLRAQEAAAARDVTALIGEYSRSTDEAVRGKVKANLSVALEKQFDMQQQGRELEAARIEAHLKKIRELMKKRTDARQTIVEKRLDQLLRDADGLGWTTPAAALQSEPKGIYYPVLPGAKK
jgi:hypothetical protein